jgi:shikimate kinase
MKIYLIGMPGSGKSTLGKQLAHALSSPFIDLDHEIEKHEQKSVSEIFAQSGEDHFRQVESKLLHEFAASPENFVMATGGGAPCFFKGIDVINETGVSVFLNVSIQTLVKHTSNRSTRPLLQNSSDAELEKKLSAIRESRLPIYQQARITLEKPDLSSLMKSLGAFPSP